MWSTRKGEDSIDEITRDLAAVQDELLAIDPDDFAALDPLRTRQAALRAEAKGFAPRLKDPRSTREIELELKTREAQYKKLDKERIDLIKQSSSGSGTAPDAIPEATLNRKLMKANGAEDIQKRIAHLKRLLETRAQS